MIQVLVVARLPIIREGLRGMLTPEQDLQVAVLDRFDSGHLVQNILSRRPDLVLIDVQVLEREGWGLLGDLRQVAPNMAILIITDTPEDRRVRAALRLGAHGYITRDASLDEAASAIRAAANGFYVLHPLAAGMLLAEIAGDNTIAPENGGRFERTGDQEEDDLIEPLSPRELDVLRLIVRGMPNKQIGAELVITEHTVKFHIRSILAKLGATNRTEAVTLALQKGLVSL